MILLALFQWVTPFLEAFMYFLLFEAFLERDPSKSSRTVVIGMFVLAVFIAVSNYYFIESLTNMVLIIAFAFAISHIFYKGAVSKKFMAVVLAVLISGTAETCSAHFVALILSVDVDTVLNSLQYRSIAILMAKIFGLYVCNTIRLRGKMRDAEIDRGYWVMFFLLFSSAAFALFLISKLTYELSNRIYTIMAIICTLGMFFTTFFSLFLYERLVKQSGELRAKERYESHMRLQMNHLKELAAKQDELRGMRHDMNNQLVTIQGYLAHQDIQNGSVYIDQLIQRHNQESLSINTGNVALDTLLSVKKTVAEGKDIAFHMDVHVSNNLPIQPIDQCVIFGNALDNAIEACERCHEGERYIDFLLIERKSHLVFKIVNPLPPDHSKTLETSKQDKDNHGY
ncbi:MAG: GHKL domain-containing protein, partial [Candidatus Saccharibacteria bacterium]|nr:GHKL domain-containing protein [Candidatus Saccharibacteria bacterium]